MAKQEVLFAVTKISDTVIRMTTRIDGSGPFGDTNVPNAEDFLSNSEEIARLADYHIKRFNTPSTNVPKAESDSE